MSDLIEKLAEHAAAKLTDELAAERGELDACATLFLDEGKTIKQCAGFHSTLMENGGRDLSATDFMRMQQRVFEKSAAHALERLELLDPLKEQSTGDEAEASDIPANKGDI